MTIQAPAVVPLSAVIETTARLFGVEAKEIVGPSRERHVVHARHVAIAAARQVCPDYGYKALALAFGQIRHTSALRAVQAVERDEVQRGRVRWVVEQLRGGR